MAGTGRWLAVAALAAGCTGGTGDEPGTGGPDVRFDPATWPQFIGPSDRQARVVAPAVYDGESLLPVVVLLHGFSANAIFQDLYLGISTRVDAGGFVYVMPEGTVDEEGAPFWNATDACCDRFGAEPDDVGYLLGLLDEAEAAFPVDPDRLSFVGHSNGGYMAYRLACEASDRIAAIAGLAGATWLDEADCGATEPVHVLHAHGTLDESVPYDGSEYAPGAVESTLRWGERAGCDMASATDASRDYDLDVDGAETTVTTWSGCARDVQLWAMEGAGHLPAINDAFRDDLVQWLLEHSR